MLTTHGEVWTKQNDFDKVSSIDHLMPNNGASVIVESSKWMMERKVALIRAKVLELILKNHRHALALYMKELETIKNVPKEIKLSYGLSPGEKNDKEKNKVLFNRLEWFIMDAIVDCENTIGLSEVDEHAKNLYNAKSLGSDSALTMKDIKSLTQTNATSSQKKALKVNEQMK